LALILSLFTKSGDLVFAEEPTYFLAKSIFADFKLNCQQIPQDKDGLDVDALEKRLQAGEIPVLMYVIPTAHNPSGRTIPAERRRKLADLSAQYKFLLVADEVYQMLTFPHITPPPPMFTYDKAGTILAMGSFSKILAPALRVGWLQGSHALLKKIVDCGQLDSSGGLNPVAYGICEKAITMGLLDTHIDWVRGELWRRYSTLRDALNKHLPEGVTFEEPQGGYFCIVRLPDGMNAKDLLPVAVENHKVQFLPGAAFSQTMDQYMRLSFSYYSAEDLALAAQRLGEAITDFMGRKKQKQ
jgi:DNA-binding transcriptional MocR family regulator